MQNPSSAFAGTEACHRLPLQTHTAANEALYWLQDVNRITDEIIQQRSLSKLSTDPSTSSSHVQSAVPHTADGSADLPSRLQQLDLASQQSPHSATAPSPELHTPKTSTTSPEEIPQQQSQGVDAADQQQLSPDRTANSAQQPQHLGNLGTESNGSSAGAVRSAAGHKHQMVAKLPAGRDVKQLSVPCVSIVGWDESPVSVGHPTHFVCILR